MAIGSEKLTTIKDQRENVAELRSGILNLLDGMNYYLDWKPSDEDWSAREIVYHLLDTPPGGTATLVRKIVSGEVGEYDIWSDRTNVTEQRSTLDLAEMEADLAAFFDSFDSALQATDDVSLQGRSVTMHQRTRSEDVVRTLEEVLAGFDRHFRAHLEQLAELREALGF